MDENKALTQNDNEELSIVDKISNSHDLAKYLSEGGTLSSELPAITSGQQDMKAYLSLYARSQLTRIEKLTNYLDKMEDKMMDDLDNYDPVTFLRAMQNLQTSLRDAIELVKLIGTDEKYLNIIYNETTAYVNNLQMGNNTIDIGLSRESRDRLRNIISQIKISSGSDGDN